MSRTIVTVSEVDLHVDVDWIHTTLFSQGVFEVEFCDCDDQTFTMTDYTQGPLVGSSNEEVT